MQRFVTLLALGLVAGAATAQPARTSGDTQDHIWARDVGSATLTLDGTLNEPEWINAESFDIKWDQTDLIPSGGWESFRIATAPPDPVDATVRFLRQGNMLWIGVEVRDKSVGGTTNFFDHDGLVMSVVDQRNLETILPDDTTPFRPHNFNGSVTDEIFFSWLNRQPGQPVPFMPDSVGMAPVFFGNFVSADGIEPNTIAGAAQVNGVSNDDFNGNASRTDDVGYTMEVTINLETLGFDMTDADGDRFPMTLGIYDRDYNWPSDPDLLSQTRGWFQNPWGGDMPFGTAYIAGDPTVTVSSGAVPQVNEPDLRIPRASSEGSIVMDGNLSENIWQDIDPMVVIQYQMDVTDPDVTLPGLGRFYTHWFRPGESEAVPVIDPSIGQLKMFYEGQTLYVGFESNDQAVSGQVNSEPRADGFHLTIQDLAPNARNQGNEYPGLQYIVYVDSTGTAQLRGNALNNAGVQAAAFLKGASTAGDPNDIDEGYSIEMAIPLDTLGVDFAGDRLIWIGLNYHDGDDLQDPTQSYGTWTWWLTERGSGPAARAYLDPNLVAATAGEGAPASDVLRFAGAFPNPTTGLATVRYELASPSGVTVEVFDVLGRLVQRVDSGLQTAGLNEARVDGRALSAGAYVVRVRLDDGTSVTGRMLVTR